MFPVQGGESAVGHLGREREVRRGAGRERVCWNQQRSGGASFGEKNGIGSSTERSAAVLRCDGNCHGLPLRRAKVVDLYFSSQRALCGAVLL